jgi:hypothetical protein
MNLKKIIKESLDEFDWIRDTEPSSPHVPYSGMRFKINDVEAGDVVYTITNITDTHMIINWIDPSDGEHTENFRWPLKHYFGFVDKGDIEIVYENLNESENDFAWITDVPLNPWLEYGAIIFDKKPKKKKLNNYIELALNTKNPSNKESWKTGRKEDIESILRYTKKYGEAVLMVDGYNNLVYADPSHYDNKTINSIKYSQLVNKKINESEEYGLEWIKDIKPISVGTVFKPVYERSPEQAFYYVIESIDEDIITFRYPTTPNGKYDGQQTSRGVITTHDLLNKIREGKISIIDNITESEEVGDFDWINDFEQPEIKFKKGDRVRIHNMGDKDAFINWLGMYGNRYLNGDFGKNIEGVVLVDEFSLTGEFSIVNVTGGHTHDEIYFPYQTKMESLNDKHQYTGLNLIYELI